MIRNRYLCALALSLAAMATPAMAERLVIIDQDAFGPGGSNMQSILMAIQAPDVKVLGITVESGDGWNRENVAHTLRLLELIGRRDIPVLAGPDLPLLNTPQATRRWEARYGKLAYKGAWTEAWPKDSIVTRSPPHPAEVVPPLAEGEPTTRPGAEPAAEWLAKTVRAHPGQVSILALGPLTNLALAVKLDPQLPQLARELVIMGGSFHPQAPTAGSPFAAEYANTPRLEFNFRFDPEAASMLLHQSWPRLLLVPVDPTTHSYLSRQTLDQISQRANTPLTRYLHQFGQPGYPLWDEVAVAVWLQPQLISQQQRLSVDVDIDHGAGYGNTLSWTAGDGPGLGEASAEVVFAVNDAGVLDLFSHLMTSAPAKP